MLHSPSNGGSLPEISLSDPTFELPGYAGGFESVKTTKEVRLTEELQAFRTEVQRRPDLEPFTGSDPLRNQIEGQTPDSAKDHAAYLDILAASEALQAELAEKNEKLNQESLALKEVEVAKAELRWQKAQEESAALQEAEILKLELRRTKDEMAQANCSLQHTQVLEIELLREELKEQEKCMDSKALREAEVLNEELRLSREEARQAAKTAADDAMMQAAAIKIELHQAEEAAKKQIANLKSSELLQLKEELHLARSEIGSDNPSEAMAAVVQEELALCREEVEELGLLATTHFNKVQQSDSRPSLGTSSISEMSSSMMTSSLSDSTDEMAKWKEAAADRLVMIGELSKEHGKLQNQVKTIQEEGEAVLQENIDLKSSLNHQTEDRERLSIRVAELEKELITRVPLWRVQQMRATSEDLEKNAQDLRSKLEEKEREVADLRGRIPDSAGPQSMTISVVPEIAP